MNNISRYGRRLERIITDNSPLILTTLGVVGSVATAFLVGKASYKGAAILHEDRQNNVQGNPDAELSNRSKVLLLWKLYIPAAGVMTLTCVCIVMANKINARRAAALAAGVALYRNELGEYKEKVEKKLGKKESKALRKEIAEDRVNTYACDENMVIHTGKGNTLFLDSYTLRLFRSSIEHVKRAEVEILSQLLREGYATQSEWFDKIKLEHTVMSEEMGWDSDDKFEVEHVPTLIKEGPLTGEPCIYLVYEPNPRLRPWKSRA